MSIIEHPTSDPVVALAQGVMLNREDVTQLRTTIKRVRQFLVIGSVSVVLIFALAIGEAVQLNSQNNEAMGQSQNTKAIATEVYTRCVQSNIYKARDQRLWDYVLGLANSSEETPAARRVVAHFRGLVDKLDARETC